MKNGVVKWFRVKKGYGFIEPEEGRGVFIHFPLIEMEGFKIRAGRDHVVLDIEHDPRAPAGKKSV